MMGRGGRVGDGGGGRIGEGGRGWVGGEDDNVGGMGVDEGTSAPLFHTSL